MRCLPLLLIGYALLAPLPTAHAQPPDTGNQPDDTNDSTSDAEAFEALWNKLVYVPYKNLKAAFDESDASVVIPYAEYWQLLQRLAGREKKPVQAVITESHYRATINGDVARIKAALDVEVLGEGWTAAPIRFGQAAIGKITSANEGENEDKKVLLRGTGQGSYELLFPAKGSYSVELDLSARVRTSPDGRRFEFECPSVGITSFELTVPEADQTVELTPELVSTPVDGEPGETKIKANLGATQKIGALWHPQVGAKPKMELLAAVTNTLSVTIQDGLVHTRGRLEYNVLRGELNEVRIGVPLGHRILGVSSESAQVESWQTTQEEKRQVVVVKLLGAVKDRAVLEVTTEAPSGDDVMQLAGIAEDGTVRGIHALDAVRESGQVVLSHGKDLTLTVTDQQGLIRIEESEVREDLRRAGAAAYKFYSSRFTLAARVRPIEPRVTVDNDARFVFRDNELSAETTLNYTIERAGVFSFEIAVPDGLLIERVTGEHVKEFNFDEDAGTLTVSLDQQRQGAIPIAVSARQELDADDASMDVTLPLLEPTGVERETGRIAVYAPESIEVVTNDEQIVGVQPEAQAPAPPRPDVRLTAAWTFTRRPVTVVVSTSRKPTRLTARVGTTIDVRQDVVEVTTLIEYRVQYAGIDVFQFAVPEALADTINIEDAPGIKQKSRAEEAQDGWVVWTIQMQRDVTGTQAFRVTYDIERAAEDGEDENEDRKEMEFEVEPLRALGLTDAGPENLNVALSAIVGEITVLKDRALTVRAEPQGDVLEPIDVRELEMLAQDGYLAFRYFVQEAALALTAARLDVQEVVSTVVMRALMETVIGRDGWASYRVRYRLKSSERQRLPLLLPKGAELLALLVEGKSVDPETDGPEGDGGQTYLVNVSRTKKSDEPFSILVQFRVPMSRLEQMGGRLALNIPTIGAPDAAGVVLQQLRTAVWVPDEVALVSLPENFERENPPSLRGLLRRLFGAPPSTTRTENELENWIGVPAGGIIDFPTEGHLYVYSNLGGDDALSLTWWDIAAYTWIVSGGLFVIAWVLRKTTWENKLGLLLLLAFVAALMAIRDIDWVLHGLIAASYGLMAMIVLWLLHALVAPPRLQPAAAGAYPTQTTVPPVVPPPGTFEDEERQSAEAQSDNGSNDTKANKTGDT